MQLKCEAKECTNNENGECAVLVQYVIILEGGICDEYDER